MSRAGGIAAPAVVLLSSIGAPVPFLVFGAVGITVGLACLGLPETLKIAVSGEKNYTPLQDLFHPDQELSSDLEHSLNADGDFQDDDDSQALIASEA